MSPPRSAGSTGTVGVFAESVRRQPGLGPDFEPFQPRRRDLTDKAIDENGRQIGLLLEVAADLGSRFRHLRPLRLDSAALLFDGLRDRRTPVRRQALFAAARFVAACVVERLVQQRVGKREDLFSGGFAEPLDS